MQLFVNSTKTVGSGNVQARLMTGYHTDVMLAVLNILRSQIVDAVPVAQPALAALLAPIAAPGVLVSGANFACASFAILDAAGAPVAFSINRSRHVISFGQLGTSGLSNPQQHAVVKDLITEYGLNGMPYDPKTGRWLSAPQTGLYTYPTQQVPGNSMIPMAFGTDAFIDPSGSYIPREIITNRFQPNGAAQDSSICQVLRPFGNSKIFGTGLSTRGNTVPFGAAQDAMRILLTNMFYTLVANDFYELDVAVDPGQVFYVVSPSNFSTSTWGSYTGLLTTAGFGASVNYLLDFANVGHNTVRRALVIPSASVPGTVPAQIQEAVNITSTGVAPYADIILAVQSVLQASTNQFIFDGVIR
jgi:hypothetical protein